MKTNKHEPLQTDKTRRRSAFFRPACDDCGRKKIL